MRMIDADALQREYMKYHDGKRIVLVDVAPTIDPRSKWIPVSERLPEVGQKVLASTNKTCFTQVFKGTSGASNSSWWWEKNTIKHIFAWQPLPDPWKGEEE